MGECWLLWIEDRGCEMGSDGEGRGRGGGGRGCRV